MIWLNFFFFFLTFNLHLRPASFSEKEHCNLDIYFLLYKVSSFLSTQFFSLYLHINLAKEHKRGFVLFYSNNRLYCLAMW